MPLPHDLTPFKGLIDLVVAQIVDEIKASAGEPNPADNEPVEMIGDTSRSESKR